MDRRSLLLAVPIMMLAITSASAQEDSLSIAFNNLSQAAKGTAQEKLAAGGFYTGKLDGTFGPGTRSAIMNAAVFVKDNSYGKVAYNLSSSNGPKRFLAALTAGDLDKYLWGEGDEAEGG